MYKLDDFVKVIDEFCPLSLSKKMIERGDYDNSGLLVRSDDEVKNILFSLDLSKEAVKMAVEKGCNTIVTHHPCIYNPIKSLSFCDSTASLVMAVKNNINVISMHLNLDIADKGIDHSLAVGLGGKEQKILDYVDETHGYGRQFTLDEMTLDEFKEKTEREFNSKKILAYGDKPVKVVASFCGGGSSEALMMVEKGVTTADTIVTSDMAHHILKELIERGKNVVIIPHYVSENYGFNIFRLLIKGKIPDDQQVVKFDDLRFM